MRKSDVHSKFEMGFDGSNRYDPQNEFYEFLEEAKNYALESDFQTSSTSYQESTGKRSSEYAKKKISWKEILFPWLKRDKLNKTNIKSATKSQVSDARRTNVQYLAAARLRMSSSGALYIYLDR